MRVILVLAALSMCTAFSTAHVAHRVRAAKARFRDSLARAKHHKRGIFSFAPPFKLGHDLPLVTHSLLKPFVVNYPPTALPLSVKVPLAHTHLHRHPLQHGHVHFDHRLPHHGKTPVPHKPDHHVHHYHKHVSARPLVPVIPPVALPEPPLTPIPTPLVPVAQPVPSPQPPIIVQSVPAVPEPSPQAPITWIPQQVQFRQFYHPQLGRLPSSVPVAPVIPAPALSAVPVTPQFNYVIKPGNAVQTSLFATYPKYPLLNYQTPLYPVPQAGHPVLLDRPAQVPHQHHIHQTPVFAYDQQHQLHEQHLPGLVQTSIENHVPNVVQSSVPLDNEGWSPVHSQFAYETTNDESHHDYHTHEHIPQVYENQQSDEQQYHDLQHQIHQHIQHQIEQAQFDQHHHLNSEYGQPEHNFDHHDISHDGHHFNQQPEHGVAQPSAEYGPPQHLNHQYAVPDLEGRISDGAQENEQFHNQFPLGFQPPIERPPEHFR